MIQEIDNELLNLKSKIKEKETLQHKLEDVMTEQRNLTNKKNALKEQLTKEQKDVDKLEKLTLKSIWYSFIGGKNEKLRQEKEELSKVEYEYKYLEETLNRLQSEIDYYKDKLYNLKQINNEYIELLNKKEKLISDTNHESYETLSKLNQDILNIEHNDKEIKEAIIAGNEVISALESIKRALNSASNWGTWDLLGGGLLSNVAKHSKLNEAESKMKDLQYLLNKYTRELRDVNMQININLDISNTLKFFDFFFDNFFSDIMVQSKISEALNQISRAFSTINYQLSELKSQLTKNKDIINNLKEQKRILLTPKS